MDKHKLWQEIEQLESICYKKRETLESLKDTVSLISKLYVMDKEQAYDVLAIMQSIIFAYTADSKEDEMTREEVFRQAGNFLSKYISRYADERR